MNKSSKLIIWGNYFGFVVMGMIVISFGSIMPYIREQFSLSFEQGGLILAIFSGSYLVSGLVSGLLVDRIGQKRVLVTGNALYVVGLLSIYASASTGMLYASVLILGMGWGICNTTVNILVNDSSKGDGKAMNLLHMSFGVGAFFIPLIFSIFLKASLTWKHMMLFLALMAFVAFSLSLMMEITFIKKESHAKKKERVGNPKQLLIYMAILFFYVGGENAFSGWLVSYLMTGLGILEGFSQNMLSTLWLTIIIGRYILSLLNKRIDKAKYIMFAGGAALLGMTLFIMTKSEFVILGAVICIGLAFAGIYPLTMAHANPIIHGSGIATALIISGGGLGATIIPFIGGRLADSYGTIAIIATIVISLLCMFLLTLINYRISRHNLIKSNN